MDRVYFDGLHKANRNANDCDTRQDDVCSGVDVVNAETESNPGNDDTRDSYDVATCGVHYLTSFQDCPWQISEMVCRVTLSSSLIAIMVNVPPLHSQLAPTQRIWSSVSLALQHFRSNTRPDGVRTRSFDALRAWISKLTSASRCALGLYAFKLFLKTETVD